MIAAKTRYFSSSPLSRFFYASAAATILYSTVAPQRPLNADATPTPTMAPNYGTMNTSAGYQKNQESLNQEGLTANNSAPKPRQSTSRERIHIIDFGMELRMQWLVLPPGLAGGWASGFRGF